jgi:hypothetical protein
MMAYDFKIIPGNTSQMMPKHTHNSKFHQNFQMKEVFGVK